MPPPSIHTITDVSAYVGVLQRAEAAGQHVRLGADGQTLEVSDMPVLKGRAPSSQMQQDQKVVAGRLDELIRQQMWSVFYGTSAKALAPALQKREARLQPGAGANHSAVASLPGLDRKSQMGLSYRPAEIGSAKLQQDLTQVLKELRTLARLNELVAMDSFASEAMEDLTDEHVPMHERLRMMAERVPEVINEFGYLGSTAGEQGHRFLEMMEKLAHALSLAAEPLEEQQAQDDATQRQQKRLLDKVRTDKSQALNKAEAARLIATQEGRQILEQHLQHALHAAREAIRLSNPTRPEEAQSLHNGLGRVEDRLLTSRPGEMDATRWQDAIEIALEQQKDIEKQDSKTPKDPSGKSSALKILMTSLGDLKQLLQKWSASDTAENQHSDAFLSSSSPTANTAPADPSKQAVESVQGKKGRSEGLLPETASLRQEGAQASSVRTGAAVRMSLDELAGQTRRAMQDNMMHMGSCLVAGFSGATSQTNQTTANKERSDRTRALLAAIAVALAEVDYAYKNSSRERLRAACSHLIPHLGNIDSLIGMAAAMDDSETLKRLFQLRKCSVNAHGNVQPSYLSFQAVPLPPEIFRDIGRSMAATAKGSSTSSALFPSEMSISDLFKAAGEIIERVVRNLIKILERAMGGAASHRLGPVLQLVLDAMADGAATQGDRARMVQALLLAIEPDLQLSMEHADDPLERQQLQALLAALVQLQNALYPAKA